MWWQKGIESIRTSNSKRRVSLFIDRDFQMRYSAIVLAASTLGMILAILPIYYFLDQNYKIFMDLSYRYSPQLLDHLERERIWVTTLLFSGFVGLTIFFVMLAFKLTNRVIGPIKVIRNHLQRLTHGNWHMSQVKIRDDDEFHDLIDCYNYFYASMRTQIKRDLDQLKLLEIDPKDRESYKIWVQMMTEKVLQLNLKSELPHPKLNVLTSASSSESPDSRRAS